MGVGPEDFALHKNWQALLTRMAQDYTHSEEVFEFKLTQRNRQSMLRCLYRGVGGSDIGNIFSLRGFLKAKIQETYQRFGHGRGRDYRCADQWDNHGRRWWNPYAPGSLPATPVSHVSCMSRNSCWNLATWQVTAKYQLETLPSYGLQ